jgi:hypothetical protein
LKTISERSTIAVCGPLLISKLVDRRNRGS